MTNQIYKTAVESKFKRSINSESFQKTLQSLEMTQMPAETTFLKHVKDLNQIERSENIAFIFIDNS